MKKAPQAKIFVIGTIFTPKIAQKKGGLGHKSAPKVKYKNYVYMGWFEVELSGMGGWVYKFPGSSSTLRFFFEYSQIGQIRTVG